MRTMKLAIALLILAFPYVLEAQLVGAVVSLTGNVFNEVTKKPVTVFLMVMDEEGNRVNATRSNAADNGYYYIAGLKPGKKYTIHLKQKNYFKEEFDLEIANTDRYQEISKDFLVKPLQKDIEIKVPVPPFELNKTKLRFGAEFLLDDLAKTLSINTEVKFQITTYPDNNDNKAENKTLTDERAKSIKEYFINNGIDASRITIQGMNSTDPDNPPPTKKMAKGKRYIGTTYIKVTEF